MKGFRKIRCVIQRGGTSKGVYFHETDLPSDVELRKKVLLAVFGSPDPRQIDGLGGADPLTSKAAIIGPSNRNDADVDYTMCQIGIDRAIVDLSGNCGNISAGVGPFAIDEGLVKGTDPITMVRIFNTNTQKILKAFVPTESGRTLYLGDYAIDGVPGTASKILLDYSETEGAVTGKLLPTGNVIDVVQVPSVGELEVSIVDIANPVCFVEAERFGLSGVEGPFDPKIRSLLDVIELLRGTVGKRLGFVEDPTQAVTESPTLPLIALVSRPKDYVSFLDRRSIRADQIDLVSRCFFMQQMHKTYPGTGAVCTAVAAMIQGTIVHRVCSKKAHETGIVTIGHPGGLMPIEVEVEKSQAGWRVRKAAFGRTSRRLMEGFVYVPDHLFGAE